MPTPLHTVDPLPDLPGSSMLIAFTGWMDGGEVSTGTVKHLMAHLKADKIAAIDPEPFYIYNFPGSMELSALFRPHVKYTQGLIEDFDLPSNIFYCAPEKNLVLFLGKEPNLRWRDFANGIFDLAARIGVSRLVFVGSFGGSVPHTREPRLYGSVSHPRLRQTLTQWGVRMTDYEGPASFATYLLAQAPLRHIDMFSFAAEIPAYLQGVNPLSIEAVTRRLIALLDLKIDLAPMRLASDEWTSQITAMVNEDPNLAAQIQQLEEAYDNELLESE